jgi:hypothetical protein
LRLGVFARAYSISSATVIGTVLGAKHMRSLHA